MSITTDNPRNLVAKLNFVLTSRRMKSNNTIEEYLPIPTTREEEQSTTIEMMFRYLKEKFVGCKIRTNNYTFSIRLDGQVHRRAEKLRKDIWNNNEWRRWIEQNHRDLGRSINQHRDSFRYGFEKRERDGKTFLYIPHRLDRINGYMNSGLIEFMTMIDNEYSHDFQLHEMYDRVIELVEGEIRRREEERRRRLDAELTSYKDSVKNQLIRPVASLTNDRDTVSGKLRAKITRWCNEKGITPVYAEEPTYQNVVPIETKVRVMNQEGSKEENWFAVPIFDDVYEVPEGYVVQEGWGRVTKHSQTDERSRNGVAPIVIENYIYTEFNLTHWEKLLPDNYMELLEATRQFREEAEEECRQEECREEEIQAEEFTEEHAMGEDNQQNAAIEFAEQVTEQAEQVEETPEARERRRRLAEQLRQQVIQQQTQAIQEEVVEEVRQEEPDVDEDLPFPATPQAQAVPQVEVERTTGIYRNGVAIPLERYIFIVEGDVIARRRTLDSIFNYIDEHTNYSSDDDIFDRVYDYNNPTEVVE